MNKVILIGNITKDLDLRKTQSNKSVIEFSVAINMGYGDNKVTEYVNIVAWEKLAERIAQYCKKGHKVAVEGQIKTDSYEKNGQKQYKTYVVANNVEFLQPRETTMQQTTLTGDGKDLMGHYDNSPKITIESDELPFY